MGKIPYICSVRITGVNSYILSTSFRGAFEFYSRLFVGLGYWHLCLKIQNQFLKCASLYSLGVFPVINLNPLWKQEKLLKPLAKQICFKLCLFSIKNLQACPTRISCKKPVYVFPVLDLKNLQKRLSQRIR